MAIDYFSLIDGKITTQIGDLSNLSATVAAWVIPPIVAIMVIQCVFYTFDIWNGTAKGSIIEFGKRQFKPFIIIILFLSGGAFATNVVGFFNNVLGSFTSLFTGATNNFVMLDQSAGAAIAAFDQAWMAFTDSVSFVTVTNREWGRIIGSGVLVICVFAICIYAAMLLILIKFSLIFLFSVGPFFVAFLAFNSTQSIGMPWVSSVMKYIFSSVVISFIVAIANRIVLAFSTAMSASINNDSISAVGAAGSAAVTCFVLFFFIKGSQEIAAGITGGMATNFAAIASNALSSALRGVSDVVKTTAGAAGAAAAGGAFMAGGAMNAAGGAMGRGSSNTAQSAGRGMAAMGKMLQQPAINRASANASGNNRNNSFAKSAGIAGAKGVSLAGSAVSSVGKGVQGLGKTISKGEKMGGVAGASAKALGAGVTAAGKVTEKTGQAASYVGNVASGKAASTQLEANKQDAANKSDANYIKAPSSTSSNTPSNARSTVAQSASGGAKAPQSNNSALNEFNARAEALSSAPATQSASSTTAKALRGANTPANRATANQTAAPNTNSSAASVPKALSPGSNPTKKNNSRRTINRENQ